ncbi:serine aminopeptidase domain-containing protein [Dyella amyloliquefaciens]|uniref:serine aminopeptidase domain-containing protein n=1 Tax=Dyella amyloliquefaciens TaxID=1770545 RepID=UPI0013EE7F89|nr:alpha/beta hydrolase [Dyella amyloliquefaciens]
MKARIEADLPFYFGPGRELFGFYHPAPAYNGTAVVLCPPLGAEQIRCHRLYRQMAHGLADGGFPVLRFDYYGTGDSAGGSRDVDWQRCVMDVATAATELRARSGAQRILAFGARLGANAALESITAGLAGVVVWDVVHDGGALVRDLDRMQEALKVDLNRFDRARPELDVRMEWQGFETTERLRAQLAGLRLAGAQGTVAWLASAGSAAEAGQAAWLGHSVESVDVAPGWDDLDRLEMAILSHPLIDAAKRHLREMA